MDKIRISGGVPLHGEIVVSGAKNAALPLLATSLLTDETMTLCRVPYLHDVTTMTNLLVHLGVDVLRDSQTHQVTLRSVSGKKPEAPYDMVRKMRASILVLGALLARYGHATVSLPGGCAIGARPVDLHMKGLQALGAELTLQDGYIQAKAPRGLQGGVYTFPKVSVTGTENLLMAAVLAKGCTELRHVAKEPEVTDLACCLNQMGAKIEGMGTDTLYIEGVPRLSGITYTVLPDRIETGTYMIATAMAGGELLLRNTQLSLLPSVVPALQQMGLIIEARENGVWVRSDHPENLKGLDIVTEPFPGFATDLQAQLMALLCLVKGASLITETIFENRFMHVSELLRMGADINIQGHSALVRGVPELRGAPVMATDLRASVSLVLAGLAAKGETLVSRVYHLDRGYQDLERNLASCGAQIERLDPNGSVRVPLKVA